MTRIENEFFKVVKKHLPSATKIDLNQKQQTLYVFFSTRNNEFDETESKIMGLLRIHSLLGGEHFDEFLSDVENLYKVFTLGGDAKNLDIKFLFV
jgi:hypothetical protein